MPTRDVSGLLPLVVGVTGHNDLRPDDLAELALGVRRVLEGLRDANPHTPLLVISPLAEGADRLVARVAVDLGLSLVVPLPLEVAAYKQDFPDPSSVAEFDALLARAERSFVVPYGIGESRERPHCYTKVGAYVARHSHMLLALWNGRTNQKVGGTADIIRLRLEGMAPEFAGTVRLLDTADTGLVHQIVTPRRSDEGVEGVLFELRVLAPNRYENAEAATRAFDGMCRRTDAFNAIAMHADSRVTARRDRSAGYLLGAYKPGDLPAELQAMRRVYAAADEAATWYQQRTRWTLLSLFWIAVGLVIAFETYAHGQDIVPQLSEPLKLSMYLGLFSAGLAVYAWARWRAIDEKHLDYRALAESLRVAFYWRVAEVREVAADYSMRHRLEETEWIRLALRARELLTPSVTWTPTPAGSAAAVQAVVDDWAKGQHAYFARTQKRDHHQLKRLERRIAVLFAFGAATGVVILASAFHILPWDFGGGGDHRAGHALMVALVGLSMAVAALVHGYAEQRALSVHIKRYSRMHAMFGAALALLETPVRNGEWPRVREVLAELGREALEENADWVMLHRERPIELPK